ncbi:MAG: hypothetical protein ACKO0M_07920 [Cyanobium sp.]
MSWWSELLLMVLAAGLWIRGLAHRDEVLGLFVRFLSVVVLLVVLIAGRPLPLELALLGLALWLPGAMRFERQGDRN